MKKQKTTANLLFVLLAVLIICGGNGFGILLGGVFWKMTGRLALAIAVAVITTVVAFSLAMVLIWANNRRIAEDAQIQKNLEEAEQKEAVEGE